MHDAAVGEHDFKTKDEVARHAIGEGGDAACVGREIATDGAASFRAERQWKQPVRVCRALLRIGEDHAGFDGHGVGLCVHRANLVEPPCRDHHFAVVRDLSADKPRIAALRHQRGLCFGGELADRGDLCGRAGTQHQRRMALKQAAFLGEIGCSFLRIGDGIFFADDRGEACEQVRGQRNRRGLNDLHVSFLRFVMDVMRCFSFVAPPRAATGR